MAYSADQELRWTLRAQRLGPASSGLGPEGRAEGGPETASAGAEGACAGRSLRVGLQISADYWWCTNVVLRGVEEVCPCVLGGSWPVCAVGRDSGGAGCWVD